MSNTPVSTVSPPPTELDGGAARRGELGAFLRSRRGRIAPEYVGLPRGRRRRTPGLRREEVAHLAAVGVTWYTWLEQGRDIQVSAQVLDAVAGALRLDPVERAHLFALAGATDPVPGKERDAVPEAVRRMLAQLAPYPACVMNGRYDILAYNRVYGQLACDLDTLPAENRNCLWLTYTNADWRAALVDVDASLRLMTANFRAARADHVSDPAWNALLSRLQQAAPEFTEIWQRHEVVQSTNTVKRFRNRFVGMLHFNSTKLWLGPGDSLRMLTYIPADELTEQRVERLHGLTSGAETSAYTDAAPPSGAVDA